MRPFPVAACLLLAASLAGCFGSFSIASPRVDMGSGFSESASLSSSRAEPAYDATGLRLDVRVSGEVETSAPADDVTVHLHLAEGACPVGPTGDPAEWADREDVPLGRLNGTAPFDATLSAPALPGTPWSVYVRVAPSGLGPSFASCHDVVASPDAPLVRLARVA